MPEKKTETKKLERDWNRAVSKANWEKGHIIDYWTQSMGHADDQEFVNRLGGITVAHVHRLRLVNNRFYDIRNLYPNLVWAHFLAALDWADAPTWLANANYSKWTVAKMREARWQEMGVDK